MFRIYTGDDHPFELVYFDTRTGLPMELAVYNTLEDAEIGLKRLKTMISEIVEDFKNEKVAA